jgi:hypothetical protein
MLTFLVILQKRVSLLNSNLIVGNEGRPIRIRWNKLLVKRGEMMLKEISGKLKRSTNLNSSSIRLESKSNLCASLVGLTKLLIVTLLNCAGLFMLSKIRESITIGVRRMLIIFGLELDWFWTMESICLLSPIRNRMSKLGLIGLTREELTSTSLLL